MLTLNKRYLRSIKKNFSFYFFSALLTAVAICLFLCFHAGVNGEKAYIDNIREETCVENGEFTLPISLDYDEIKELENAKKELEFNEKKLANTGFISKAPEKLVNDVRANADKFREKIKMIEAAIDALNK